MDNEGEDAYEHLCVVQVVVDPGDVDHEAGAMYFSVLAGHVVLIQRPEELERVVAADRHQQQDDAVLDEHVEEGEPEAQELQLLRVLAQRRLLLVDRVQAARAELVGLLAARGVDDSGVDTPCSRARSQSGFSLDIYI